MTGTRTAFTATLRGSRFVAERTLYAELELSDPAFSFRPGQAIFLSFPDNQSFSDRARTFSICSAPWELPVLAIATRLTEGSIFKRDLENSLPGQLFSVDGPEGDFLLPDPPDPAIPLVLLAGGIGITPFRSMIRERLHRGDRGGVFLMTVNRTLEDTPFSSECGEWNKTGISWFPVLTKGKGDPMGREERIHGAIAQILERSGNDPLFYIAGPPAMVESLKETLLGQFLLPADRIRTDLFYGYAPH